MGSSSDDRDAAARRRQHLVLLATGIALAALGLLLVWLRPEPAPPVSAPAPVAASAPRRSEAPATAPTRASLDRAPEQPLEEPDAARPEPPAEPTPAAPQAPAPATELLERARRGEPVALTSQALNELLPEVYGNLLPPELASLSLSVEGDELVATGELGLGLTGEAIASLIGNENLPSSSVRVAGKLVASDRQGVGVFRIREVRVGDRVIPERLVAGVVRRVMDARGYAIEDPLARPFYLPTGVSSARVSADRMLLNE